MYVVDPGHPNQSVNPESRGYGAVYDGEDGRIEEKNLNLEVSKKLQDYAREHGVRVELTRDRDKPESLADRCRIEREFQPEAFLSIHFNWFRQPEPRGSSVFYLSDEGEKVAECVGQYMEGYVSIPHRRERATESERDDDLTPYLYVLNHTDSPAILAELAFLSNPKDRAMITNDREQFTSQYAIVLFWGLQHYSHTREFADENECANRD